MSGGRSRPAEGGRQMIGHDVHAHFYPREYSRVVAEVAGESGRHSEVARAFLRHGIIQKVPTFTGNLRERIRLLDSAGIGVQVLSFASLNIWHPAPRQRARLTAAYNDGCAAASAEYPDRLRFLATLPFPHVPEAVAEVRRARTLPGCVGYTIPTHIDGAGIDDPRWDEVYAAMNEAPALVLVHPDGFLAPGVLDDYSMEWALGAPFDDTIAAVRLLCSGILDRYSRLNWVVPHLGGTLPFLLHRLLWRWQLEADLLGTSSPGGVRLERLLFDTANSTPETLRLAIDILPAGSLVFGTDFPFVDPTDLARPVAMVRDLAAPGFSSDRVLHGILAPHVNPPNDPNRAQEGHHS